MTKEELDIALDSDSKYKEIWVSYKEGQSICALINGNIGWLMYLRHECDTGFSTRNPKINSNDTVEFFLNNGQCDEYPANWTYNINTIKEALASFLENGMLPEQVSWHDDSVD